MKGQDEPGTWRAADVRYRLAEGRGSRMDWLADGCQVSRLGVTLAAMANAQGGCLILGVEPEANRIAGLRNPGDTIEALFVAAQSLEPPLILPMPQPIPIDGRQVVAARIPADMPHLYALEGRYFVRDGPLNSPLAAARLRRLLLERGDPGAEADCPSGASLDDLDLTVVSAFMNTLGVPAGGDFVRGLQRRGCATIVDGRPAVTLAGLLLFGRDPQRWAPNAEIRLTYHAGRTPTGQLRRQLIRGRLMEQIRAAVKSLAAILPATVTMPPGWGWPVEAVRQVIANAIVHRDYALREAAVHVDVFSDRLEVHSPGGLPGPVTLDTLSTRSFRRNPAIAQVLDDIGGPGAQMPGLQALADWADRSGHRPPVIEEAASGLRVTLYARGESFDRGGVRKPGRVVPTASPAAAVRAAHARRAITAAPAGFPAELLAESGDLRMKEAPGASEGTG